jgi:hypothetical protein
MVGNSGEAADDYRREKGIFEEAVGSHRKANLAPATSQIADLERLFEIVPTSDDWRVRQRALELFILKFYKGRT